MKQCAHVNESGNQCDAQYAGDEYLCYVHDPQKLPVFFFKDRDWYHRNDIVDTLPIETAQHYIDCGVAVRIDDEMRDRMDKALIRCAKQVKVIVISQVREMIEKDDTWGLIDFFEGKEKAQSPKAIKFIESNGFTDEEKEYLHAFIRTL